MQTTGCIHWQSHICAKFCNMTISDESTWLFCLTQQPGFTIPNARCPDLTEFLHIFALKGWVSMWIRSFFKTSSCDKLCSWRSMSAPLINFLGYFWNVWIPPDDPFLFSPVWTLICPMSELMCLFLNFSGAVDGFWLLWYCSLPLLVIFLWCGEKHQYLKVWNCWIFGLWLCVDDVCWLWKCFW